MNLTLHIEKENSVKRRKGKKTRDIKTNTGYFSKELDIEDERHSLTSLTVSVFLSRLLCSLYSGLPLL